MYDMYVIKRPLWSFPMAWPGLRKKGAMDQCRFPWRVGATRMTIKRLAFRGLLPLLKKMYGDVRVANLSRALVPEKPIMTPSGVVTFYCSNGKTVSEVEGLLTHERDTIDWINEFEQHPQCGRING